MGLLSLRRVTESDDTHNHETFRDRKDLLYVVEIKQLAAKTMVESISTEDRQIVLRFHSPKELEGLSLSHDYGGAVKIGTRQIKLDVNCLSNGWQEMLKKLLQNMATNI